MPDLRHRSSHLKQGGLHRLVHERQAGFRLELGRYERN
ncbi:putative protein without homology [Propionibacterium freudenreichii subsp. shermanii]|nr:putative protein without homology [Propionibacterium freudenreichii subsp. shermanii]